MRLSRALVIGEVALSCALLIVVGTMIRGIVTLDRIDLGFDASHLLSARIGLFTNTYPTGADQVRLFEKLTERLRGDAQVVEASVATTLPLRFGSNRDLLPEGVAAEGDNVAEGALRQSTIISRDLRFCAFARRFFDQRRQRRRTRSRRRPRVRAALRRRRRRRRPALPSGSAQRRSGRPSRSSA